MGDPDFALHQGKYYDLGLSRAQREKEEEMGLIQFHKLGSWRQISTPRAVLDPSSAWQNDPRQGAKVMKYDGRGC